jgi:hypothetical protein
MEAMNEIPELKDNPTHAEVVAWYAACFEWLNDMAIKAKAREKAKKVRKPRARR